jgi:tetratricopeptide (TPR) repeat protein
MFFIPALISSSKSSLVRLLSKRSMWAALVLATAAVAVYLNALHNTFLQDDLYNITQNTFIRDLSQWRQLFSKDYFRLAQEGAYRPIPTFVLMLDHAAFGYHVEGYRLMNLLWHTLSTLLLFFLLRRFLAPWMAQQRTGASSFLAAMLFAVHPVHSQMMAVIAYHEDLLMFLLCLTSFHLYLNHLSARSKGAARKAAGMLIGAWFAFGLALFCKEMAVGLSVAIFLYHLFLEKPDAVGDNNTRRRALRNWPWPAIGSFFVLSLLFAIGRFTVYSPIGIMMESDSSRIAHLPRLMEFPHAIAVAATVYLRYLGLLIWPSRLSMDWDSILIHQPVIASAVAASLALLTGLVILGWRMRKTRPWFTFAIAYFLFTLLPVSGLIPFWSFMAERYVYMPSLGFFMIAGCLLEILFRQSGEAARRPAAKVALGLPVLLIPLALAMRTVRRNADYKNELTLFKKETVDHPSSYGAWYGLGFALGREGRYEAARDCFRRAETLDDYHKIHFMLAFSEEKLNGAPETIEAEYKKAIEIEPEYYPAHFNLGSFYHKHGKIDLAISQYREAIRINPGYREARANLGAALLQQQKFAEAALELTRALETSQELDTSLSAGLEAKIRYNLALALSHRDRNEHATARGPAAAPGVMARLQKLYPQLAGKWTQAERGEFVESEGNFSPKRGFMGSSQMEDTLKPEERAALATIALRDGIHSDVQVLLPELATGAVTMSWGATRIRQKMLGVGHSVGRADNGLFRYRNAYPATDVFYIAEHDAVEQFFFLSSRDAPLRFESELSLDDGELREEADGNLALYAKGKKQLNLSPPIVFDVAGKKVSARWQAKKFQEDTGSCRYQLAFQINNEGLRYPLLVDPTWSTAGAGSLSTARFKHTATLLSNGKVLVAGGTTDGTTALLTAELYDPATGSWSATGSMSTARYLHTATLLPNGKVLVAGGKNAGYALTAELYDPSTGLWSTTGSLSTSRGTHTATVLANGKVLVVGGYNGTRQPTAELYDPSAGTWSTAASLSTARSAHTATLLSNGNVLVAGGYTGSVFIRSCELYDVASDSWTTTGPLGTARSQHTATRLTNDKVLAVGGFTGDVASAELYDPSTGLWTATGSLSTGRGQQSATLLPNGNVIVAGGATGDGVTDLVTAEQYDPSSGAWSTLGSLGVARGNHTATLLPSGTIIVAGGTTDATNGNSSVELYDPSVGVWNTTGLLGTAREKHTATLLPNGKVLVAGGLGLAALVTAELYDPSVGTWSVTGSLSTARYNHTATLLPNGKVLVAGGFAGISQILTAEIYDPAGGTWSTTGSLGTARSGHTATLLPSGKVLVAAGGGLTAEVYNPAAGTWSVTGSLGTARSQHTATLLPNGKVLVTGGFGASAFLTAELYDSVAGTWSATGSLGTARSAHTATLLPNGKVLVVGGSNADVIQYLTAEVYDPSAGTWSTTGSLGTARFEHTATLLSNGKALVAGGSGGGVNVLTAEIYDPGTGTWSATGSLGTAHSEHTTTLLPNGKVLMTGGTGSDNFLTTEIYDPNSDILSSAKPQVGAVPVFIAPQGSGQITGLRFQGISGGSMGGTQDSSSNYPLIQLRGMDSGPSNYSSGASTWTKVTNWSSTGATIDLPSNLTSNYYMLLPVVNGIVGEGTILKVTTPAGMDSSAPGPITTLFSAQPSTTVVGALYLTWSSPGDDGAAGKLDGQYRVQYSSYAVTWATSSAQIGIAASSVAAGALQHYTLQNLTSGVTYYVRMWASDEEANWSSVSSGATAYASYDTFGPNAVQNLVASSGPSAGSLVLSWNSPVGTTEDPAQPDTYILKYATFTHIGDTTAWWNSAYTYSQSWTVQSAGSSESKFLYGFHPGTTYYFALKTADYIDNISAIDALAVSSTTQARAFAATARSNITLYQTVTTPSGFPSGSRALRATSDAASDITTMIGTGLTSSASPGDAYRFLPLISNTGDYGAGAANLPSATTGQAWIADEDLTETNLVAGTWTLNMRFSSGSRGSAITRFRLSKVSFSGETPTLTQALTGWTTGPTFGTSVSLTTISTTAVVGAVSFGSNEYLVVEYGATVWKTGSPSSSQWVALEAGTANNWIKTPAEATETVAPNAVTSLTAAGGTESGTINLTWIAPGDDGTSGTNGPGAFYTVTYATFAATNGLNWWNGSEGVVSTYSQVWSVGAQGSTETYTVSGLTPGTRYWFGIRSTDDFGNQSSTDTVATQANAVATSGAIGPITSAGSGNWHTLGTWAGGVVPSSSTTVIIAAGHVVTSTASVSVSSVNVNATGSLRLDGTNQAVVFSILSGGKLVNNGTVQVLSSANAVTLQGQPGYGMTFEGTDIDYNGNKIYLSSVTYQPAMSLASGETVELSGNVGLGPVTTSTGASFIVGNNNILMLTGNTAFAAGTFTRGTGTARVKLNGNISLDSAGQNLGDVLTGP